MNDQPIDIMVLPERPTVRNDELTEFDIVIEIRCHAVEGADRSGGAMNLCLVMDRSGSMAGQNKLETAKRSCASISRRITGDDLLTVVTFDNESQVVVNPQTPREEVEELIGGIRPGGSTNLSLGWYQGLLELQSHMTENHYGRLILLSDGMANSGETKKAALAAVASRARDEGISTSTIGIGNDFQEDLLEAIASASGGRFWYISDTGIDSILDEEFRGALSVVVDRPRVELVLPPGVTVSQELNSLRRIPRRYMLRPLKGLDTFNFAVRLQIDPAQQESAEFTICAVLYDDSRRVAAVDRAIALAPLAEVVTEPVHGLVRSVVEQYQAETTDERLLDELESDDLSGMKQMLTAEVTRMRQAEFDVAGQVAAIGMDRAAAEMRSLGKKRQMSETSVLVIELTENHLDQPEVRVLMSTFRKSLKHEGQRNRMRWNSVNFADDEVEITLLIRALGVADLLIERFPADRAVLEAKRERLRERLASLS
ncbi:VWA domain-containing protein [Streptomyces sp. MBT55]|uniref:vWA domain-containing protein n=1 Tax=Streptomyces sp. MBT55 TaxID=1488386 RepID=UPI001912A458|nr:VWA domain-containing protein [Streptomyces sp. MBT55]MBK6041733.1 VWA domain-containing protein [Streptomyces sp. MBT55]